MTTISRLLCRWVKAMTFMRFCAAFTSVLAVLFALAFVAGWQDAKLPLGVAVTLMLWIMGNEVLSRVLSERFYERHPELRATPGPREAVMSSTDPRVQALVEGLRLQADWPEDTPLEDRAQALLYCLENGQDPKPVPPDFPSLES
jgi:hypothetical protein